MAAQPITKNNIWRYSFFVIALISLHVFFTFYQTKPATSHYNYLTRSWGFNHVKFYDTPYIISFYLLALASAIPVINSKIFYFIETLSANLERIKKGKILCFILIGFIAGILFYIFRNKYFLLGDYTLRVTQTMKQDFLVTEYVTMKILYHVSTFLGKYNLTPIQSFVLVSCVSGGLYITISCFIADLLGKNNLQRFFLLIGGTTSGMLLIFCGYIDIYALPLLFTIIYIYATLLYIRNKKYFVFALAGLIIAISGHLLCISFAPSLFIAWYYHNKTKLPFITKMQNKTKVYSILALTLLAIILAYKSKTGFVLPVKAPPTNLKYLTIFSFTHLWEFINGQLLGCGISFILVFYLIYKTIKEKIVLSIETYFFIAASAGMTLTVFLANLHRGSGDWDIQSFTAITLNTSIILLLLGIQNKHKQLTNYLLIIVILFNSLNAILWIHINSNDKSLAKVENMLTNDPGTYYTSKLPGLISLIYIYKENKIFKEAERISLQACNTINDDFRGCLLHAEMLITQKKNNEAAVFYENLLQRNQNVATAYMFLIFHYQNNNQNEKVIPMVSKFYEAFKLQPNAFLAQVKLSECLNLIEYYRNYLVSINQTANLKEMESIITQLKQVQQQNPAAK